MSDIQYFSPSQIAERWGVSLDKASRTLERYRGKLGFMDLGQPHRNRKRKYAIIRISPALLEKIEGDLRMTK